MNKIFQIVKIFHIDNPLIAILNKLNKNDSASMKLVQAIHSSTTRGFPFLLEGPFHIACTLD